MSTQTSNSDHAPYVILLGDVGTGKSTILEKMTGESGRSSEECESFTKESELFWVPDGSLLLADTPGSNSMSEKLHHNVWIAAAFNCRPVSAIFIVVKAEIRIDTVVSNVRKYADCFIQLPMDVVAVLVTHMDMVTWTGKDFVPKVEKELGIDKVVFSRIDKAGETLVKEILRICSSTKKYNLTVDGETFFDLFKIHNHHGDILKCTRKEIKKFKKKKEDFETQQEAYEGQEKVDLFFEFQTYMTSEIEEAKKRMSIKNNFHFLDAGAENEASHIANMVNQLRAILFNIRVKCNGYQSEHGVSELRKCPHCGLIWTKVEGCDGDTTCGNRPSTTYDVRDPSISVLATFTFTWANERLIITKSGKRDLKSNDGYSEKTIGCGKKINWKKMSTVELPAEFNEVVNVCTTDVKSLPKESKPVQISVTRMINYNAMKMKVPDRPKHK